MARITVAAGVLTAFTSLVMAVTPRDAVPVDAINSSLPVERTTEPIKVDAIDWDLPTNRTKVATGVDTIVLMILPVERTTVEPESK